MSSGMGIDDINRQPLAGHWANRNDLENRSRSEGNLKKGLGGTRHGAYVQATGAWRW